MNVGATGGLPAQPATWDAGPNGGGGVTLVDPNDAGFIVLSRTPKVAGDPFSGTGFNYLQLFLAAGTSAGNDGPGLGVGDSTTGQNIITLDYDTSVFAAGGSIKWANAAAGVHQGALYVGTGVPANAGGANGDFALRTDTPGVANQRIYVKSAGAWVGIL